MTVRCKFQVTYKAPSADGSAEQIRMSPVMGGSPENEAFFKSTPGGMLDFWTINKEAAAQLEPGKAYYIDIIPA